MILSGYPEVSRRRGADKLRKAKRAAKVRVRKERKSAFNVGDRFGMLQITELAPRSQKAVCRCDCGKETTAWTGNLRKGATSSCGCTQGTHKHEDKPCLLAQVWK